MIRLPLVTGLLIGLFSMSACTLIPQSEALAVYQFPQPSQLESTPTSQPLSLSLRIDTPHTGYAYSGPRLMVQTQNNQLLSYKGVRWSDPTPTLLREYLVLAFQRQSKVGTITTDEKALYADVHLGSDLLRFQVIDNNAPHILIELQARLINPESRRIYVSHDFSVQQPIKSTNIQHVIEGYGQASAALASQLLSWAVPQLDAISKY